MKRVPVTVGLIITFVLFPLTCVLGQTVIFEEDFDTLEAMDNWEDTSALGDQYSIEMRNGNGVLVSNQSVYENIGYLVYRGPDGNGLSVPDSFEISCKTRMEQAGTRGSDEIAVDFVFYDNANEVFFGWRQNQYNDFRLYLEINGVRTVYGLVGTDEVQFDETQWHTVRLVKDGLTVWAYLDDTLMFTETIPRLADITGGTIALLGSDGIFEFDDLLITIPGPPPAISGCIELYGEPLADTRVFLNQIGVRRQITTTDEFGCFEFDEMVENRRFILRTEFTEAP
jgi:hypothetical protein